MNTQTHEGALTRISATRADVGRVRVVTSVNSAPGVPALRPMLLSSDADSARISLVPDGALLLAGDRVAVDVHVGSGVRLELVEPAGTVAYGMAGDSATWDVILTLDEAATLLWAGEPFVIAAGARVRRATRVSLGAGARLALREILVLGRHGEPPGSATATWEAHDHEGRPLLVESLDLDADATRPGILGGHRVLGSVTAFGVPLNSGDASDGRLDLEHRGTTWRHLTRAAHQLPTEPWKAVSDALRG